MAERIADNAELIVDEMRRKARRRLVGAIVLALAVAIVVPMLLEKDPRPLGDDVSVQIPPIDQGKFVNRLTGKSGDAKTPLKSDGKSVSAGTKETAVESATATSTPAPAKSEAVAQKAEAAATAKTEPAAKTEPPAKAESAAKAEPVAPDAKSETRSAPKADTKPAASAESVTESKPAVATATPANGSTAHAATSGPATSKPDGFVVQLAAFADDKGANALANKLKKGGYAAYVEPVSTSRGTLWRVRVGGYGTRPEADAARVALKGEGYSGIIAPSQ